MEKNVLFLSGEISEEEVIALSREFLNSEYEILKYTAASISGFHDFVNLFFNDFSPYSFARDLILGKLLDRGWKAVKPVLLRLRGNKKDVSNLTIAIEYQKQDGTILYIKFHTQVDRFETLIKEVYNNLAPDYFEGIKGGRNVSVTLDRESQLLITVAS